MCDYGTNRFETLLAGFPQGPAAAAVSPMWGAQDD